MSLIDKIRDAQIRAGEQAVIQHLRDMGAADMPISDIMGEGVPQIHRVDATSDQRTVNNVMRHEYRVLNEDEKKQMKMAKDWGLQFHEFLATMGPSREISLAQTKVEEAVMWAVKSITK